jgi:hypothetical protein
VKEVALYAVRKIGSALTMLRISAVIKTTAVVQKAKELNHQKIGLTDFSNGLAMVKHPSPMVCPMNTAPIQLKFALD